MLTLKLKAQPDGFDVVQLDSGGLEQPYTIGDEVNPGVYIRVKRQPVFLGSGTLVFTVTDSDTGTETDTTEETGAADIRDDCLIPVEKAFPTAPGWRLQTNCECFPKS
jgi:hypothetical protein